MKPEGWAVTRWASAALLLMVAMILLAMGWTDASLRLVVRSTARTSLCLFLLAFSASSLCRLWPARPTRWFQRNRRYVGVSFAVSHLLHLSALGSLAMFFPKPFASEQNIPAVLGGGLAYLFIAAMALTSSDRAQALLGRYRWRWLHLVGGYFLWLVFAESYLRRALNDLSDLPFAVLVIAALALRVAPRPRVAGQRAGASVAR